MCYWQEHNCFAKWVCKPTIISNTKCVKCLGYSDGKILLRKINVKLNIQLYTENFLWIPIVIASKPTFSNTCDNDMFRRVDPFQCDAGSPLPLHRNAVFT